MSGERCPSCGFCADEPARSWVMEFRCQLPSLNKVGSNSRGQSGRNYRNQRRSWTNRFAREGSDIPRAETHRQVIITRQYKARTPGTRDRRSEYDYDNLVGGCKPLVDALRETGLIVNDHGAVATVVYKQEPSTRASAYVLIEIQEFGDGRSEEEYED